MRNREKCRFCSDCKVKVIKAFNLLVGEVDQRKEKAFNAQLYEGITRCNSSASVPNCYYLSSLSLSSSSSSCSNNNTNEWHVRPIRNNNNSIGASSANKKHDSAMYEQHLHLKTDRTFIAGLISRAEPDVLGR